MLLDTASTRRPVARRAKLVRRKAVAAVAAGLDNPKSGILILQAVLLVVARPAALARKSLTLRTDRQLNP